MKTKFLIFAVVLLLAVKISFSQDTHFPPEDNHLKLTEKTNSYYSHQDAWGNLLTPFAIGMGVAILIANPMALYENDKFYFALAKEISVSYGKDRHIRNSFEYAYVFSNPLHSRFWLSMKYDFFGKPQHNQWFDILPVFTVGAGFYADKEKRGIFPEVSFGLRGINKHFLFQPFIKARHTFIFDKDKSSVSDVSMGAAFGYIF
jgi:hypothetical protein